MPEPIAPPLSTPPPAPEAPTSVAVPTEPDPSIPLPDSGLERDQPVQHDTEKGSEQRGSAFERLQQRRQQAVQGTPAPAAQPPTPKPVEPPKPTETPKPAETPEPPKPTETPKPAETPEPPKSEETPKPPADNETLPEDLLEGLAEGETKHRQVASNNATMRRRLKAAGELIKAQKAELAKRGPGGEGGMPPPDYEQVKTRAQQLEVEVQERDKKLAEAQDRLYATELRARPEYQNEVIKPWMEVQKTLNEIVGQYPDIRMDDVYAALNLVQPGMTAEQQKEATTRKKAILDEIASQMTSATDKDDFFTTLREIPKIADRQRKLEADSKEKLETFRSADKKKADERAAQDTGRALAMLGQHREARKQMAPGLFHMDGDTPQAKEYNDGMDAVNKRAESFIREGFDNLRPETKAMMVQDALVSDHVLRNVSNILQSHVAKTKELEAKLTETETALKTAQSELDEYKAATPGGGGYAPGATPGAAAGSDSTSGDRAIKHFSHLR